MHYINYRILEISVSLALGISMSHWMDLPKEALLLIVLCWLYLLYRYHADRNLFTASLKIPFLTYFLFFQIGYWSHYFHLEIYKSESLNLMTYTERSSLWILTIESIGTSDTTLSRYTAHINRRNDKKISGQVYLTINQADSLGNLQPNDVLLAYGKLKRIEPSPNPNQFDFVNYMAQKGIYYSMALETSNVIKTKKGYRSLQKRAEELRSNLVEKLDNTPLDRNVKAITRALTLGDRSDIDEVLYESYAKAGGVHILAISGLHIGIILVLLNQLFSFLLRFPKGRMLRTFIVISLLWGFAILTGLSPSVVRAVGMFSLFCIGDLSERPTKGINTLSLSFFITLIFAPSWLFHLGFQMSYLAVGSILLLQPQFQKLWTPKLLPVKKLWEIFTVSLAAQLAVAPISLYYFHQFPGLFWLTNWILLPVLALVLIYAFVIIVLSNISSIPMAPYEWYNLIVSNMNSFITWIGNQEDFVFQTGSTSLSLVFIAYVLILGFSVSKIHLLRRTFLISLGFLLLISSQSALNSHKSTQQLIWFHTWGESCFVIETKDTIKVYSTIAHQEWENPIKNYLKEANKPFELADSIPRIFKYNQTTYVVIDSLGIYPNLLDVVVVLRKTPKLHIERMVNELQPKLVIADGSNYSSQIRKWSNSFKDLEVPFWVTSKAAYINKIN